MDIPVNVDVYCTDGICGRTNHVVLSPKTEQITHVVVHEKGIAKSHYLVPLSMIIESTPRSVKLNCTKAQLEGLDQFIVTDYIPAKSAPLDMPAYDPTYEMYGGYFLWPSTIADERNLAVKHEQVPTGEFALVKGAQVIARDGIVGRVDEFLTDSTGKITHLVMRKGHLWGQRDVTIALGDIERIESKHVYLKLDKQSVGALPALTV